MTEAQDLVVDRSGPGGAVATLVLNRPDSHNAIRLEMYEALPALLREIDDDRRCEGTGGARGGTQGVRLRSRHQRVPRGASQCRVGTVLQRARRGRRAGARGNVQAHDSDGARLLHRGRMWACSGLRHAVRGRERQLRDHPSQTRPGLQPRVHQASRRPRRPGAGEVGPDVGPTGRRRSGHTRSGLPTKWCPRTTSRSSPTSLPSSCAPVRSSASARPSRSSGGSWPASSRTTTSRANCATPRSTQTDYAEGVRAFLEKRRPEFTWS